MSDIKIKIDEATPKNPITIMGRMVGVAYGSDISNDEKNYKRGLECIQSGHYRTLEYADIFFSVNGISARTLRQFYTHIGGLPTRTQGSTRYINYLKFNYVVPSSISNNPEALRAYLECMSKIQETNDYLQKECGVPQEDSNMILPLAMHSSLSCKINSRNIMSMSEQRKCKRTYWEFRDFMTIFEKELRDYSDEWNVLANYIFKVKCEKVGFCEEKYSCGRYPKKEEVFQY